MEPLFDINKTGPLFKVNPIKAKPFLSTEKDRKPNNPPATICRNCRFFVPIENSDDGECRRYPPIGGQLLVGKYYGCGEFYLKQL